MLTIEPIALSPDTLHAVPNESCVIYNATIKAAIAPFGSPA